MAYLSFVWGLRRVACLRVGTHHLTPLPQVASRQPSVDFQLQIEPPPWPSSDAVASLSSRHLVTTANSSINITASAPCAQAGSDGASISNPVLQRYDKLLQDGSLQSDDQQRALVQKLAALYDDICSYKAKMDEFHRATQEHQARRLARLQELLEEERRLAARQQEREARDAEEPQRKGKYAATAPASASASGSWSSWVSSALAPLASAVTSLGGASAAPTSATALADTPLARERLAASRREERLDRELGPPPKAPEPPRGIYVWGSVGSGKSMLVALFYQALAEHAGLPAHRWMHFNAAMLEVHSRLHHLDTERWRLRDERERAHQQHLAAAAAAAAAAQQQQQSQPANGLGPSQPGGQELDPRQGAAAGGLGTGGMAQSSALHTAVTSAEPVAGSASEDQEEDEEEEDGDDLPVPASRQGVFAHWDPKLDPEVQRQREAKAAMLAVRRHMRLARLGRNNPQTLAAANAQGLVRMAASFIRGRAGDPLSGWAAGSSGPGPIASVLYFDEVQVTDVFSAVALKGLVEALTSAGCVLVATSNRAPHELPRHGLHEDMWQHFVDTLLQRCEVHELSSAADYRRVLLEQGRANIAASAAAAAAAGTPGGGDVRRAWPPLQRSYLHPAGPDSTAELERLWRAQTHGAAGTAGQQGPLTAEGGPAMVVPVLFGRSLEVPRASPCGGAAWFSFGELCGRPLGPADYVALSQRFHTVFLQDIPAMSMQVRDQARRFITLVDELYNARCVLVASAEVAPEELFTGAEGQEPILDLEGLQFETAVEGARLRRDAMASGGVAPVLSASSGNPSVLAAAAGALGGAEERFAFRRAVSRLLEMQSPQYILAAMRMRQARQSNGNAA